MKLFFNILILGFLLFSSAQDHIAEADEDLFQITVLNVGKGDCILIQTGDKMVMIDTGYKETADEVIKYLNEHNITRLDALIISHFHKDHVGGAAAILDRIPVDAIYLPDYEGTRDVYQEMLSVIREKDLQPQRVTSAVTFQLGDAEYHIYPSSVPYDPEEENDNDVSMCASVKYQGHSAFFAGDLEEAGITSLTNYAQSHDLDLYCDILKLPHHGRTSENSADLLDLISPKIAMITDGSSQRAYGEMIDMLDQRNIDYYCSAADGTYRIQAAGTSDYTAEKSNNPDHNTSGPWIYTISEDGTASIAGYTGNDKELTVPSEIDGYPVKSIADSVFYNHTKLTSVTIPDSVTKIGDSAFSWCTKLQNISISKNLTDLGAGAFSWCEKLEHIIIPDGVTTIGEYTFFHCKKLAELIIPDQVTYIGEKACSHCNKLEQITIPASVKTIEEEAFKKCKSLKTVAIENGLKTIKKSMFADCESLEDVSIPASVKTIKGNVFKNCSNLSNIYYDGSEEMWMTIDKTDSWDANTPAGKQSTIRNFMVIRIR